MPAYPPLIIIGMHRSGTSLVTRLLEGLGMFAGWRRDRNDEAVFFQRLNDWLFRQCGAAWDSPHPFTSLLDDKALREIVVDYLDRLVRGPRVASYLGPKRFVSYRTPFNLDRPWGWKDPRNTYTLPLWLELFPDARVVHVTRHGVDVAQSLRARQIQSVGRYGGGGPTAGRVLSAALRRGSKWRNPAGLFRAAYVASAAWIDLPLHWRFASSVRCGELDGGFALWEEYAEEAARNVAAVGDRGMTVRYEDLLHEPAGTLAAVVRLCGLDVAAHRLADVVEQVRGERAFAYRRDPALHQFAMRVAQPLSRHGYQVAEERR
jgi:hypothetical protein